MKKFVALASAIAVLGFVNAASAADMPVKAPMAPVARYNWTGFYIGAQGGGAWVRTHDLTSIGTDTGYFSGSGATVGGTLGYNWQVPGGPWLLGIEGDGNWANVTASGSSICTPACQTKVNSFGTIRGRAGYVGGQWLLYATGGFALAGVNPHQTGNFNYTESETGWTAGGGVEWMFMPRWSVKAEYLYMGLKGNNSAPLLFAPPNTISVPNTNIQVVRVGVNWHF